MRNIALFASGSGTNAENLMAHFREHPRFRVKLVLCNNPAAGVLERAERMGIPSVTFTRGDLYSEGLVLGVLQSNEIDYILLAGFLWLIPASVLDEYPGRIINIHPALLPAYGGKGMYGRHVHEAVIRNGEKESGITIHLVNQRYDEGDILFQARCKVFPDDTPETLAARVHELEYRYYPGVAEAWMNEEEEKDSSGN